MVHSVTVKHSVSSLSGVKLQVRWPFVSRIKRSRRSDWPVLVFALLVAAIVTLGCCLAAFAAFSAWNPFGG